MLTDAHQLERRGAILRILRSGLVRKQADLVRLLKKEGHEVTQSSVSRDLRDLGVFKARGRYVLPPDEVTRANGDFGTLAQFVRELRSAGPSITVLRTTIGAAQSVAVAIDKARVAGSGRHHLRRRHHLHRHRQRACPGGAARRACAHSSGSKSCPSAASRPGATPIVLAYSGGLDTSFLVPWIAENHGRPVITVTVDTGGIDAAAAQHARRARPRARAPSRTTRSMRARTTSSRCCAFSSWGTCAAGSFIRCASAPSASCRRRPSRAWRANSAPTLVAHGCTAAGNDQVRFEVALRTLAPELTVLAPVRDRAFRREEELDYLQRAQACRCRPSGRRVLGQPRPVGRHHRW